MPFYQFTVPADSATARKKAEVAAAVTAVHAEVTGAPSQYVNCSFVEVPPGSIFEAGTAIEAGRMVGLVPAGPQRRGQAEADHGAGGRLGLGHRRGNRGHRLVPARGPPDTR